MLHMIGTPFGLLIGLPARAECPSNKEYLITDLVASNRTLHRVNRLGRNGCAAHSKVVERFRLRQA